MYDEKFKKRFWAKVNIQNDTSKCWEWNGAINLGYGVLKHKNKIVYAHRIAFIIFNSRMPNKRCIYHSCDNPKCCNPYHLFEGSIKDNILDNVEKDRHVRGSKMPTAKLNEDQVREIRKIYNPREFSYRKIANIYNVTTATIMGIIQRKSWKHVI